MKEESCDLTSAEDQSLEHSERHRMVTVCIALGKFSWVAAEYRMLNLTRASGKVYTRLVVVLASFLNQRIGFVATSPENSRCGCLVGSCDAGAINMTCGEEFALSRNFESLSGTRHVTT